LSNSTPTIAGDDIVKSGFRGAPGGALKPPLTDFAQSVAIDRRLRPRDQRRVFSMRQDLSATPDVVEVPAGRSRLLSRLYRDVGLAAVAAELNLPASAFDLEVGEAVERGSRYLAPRRMLDLAS
jgi:hypothetical protein